MTSLNLIAKTKRLQQYVITSAYLKPIQILYRIKSVFQTKCLHRFKAYRDSYLDKATGNESFTVVQFPYIRPANFQIADIDSGKFCFLNRAVDLGVPTNWQPSSETKLWTYNLHYFDFVRSIIRFHPSQHTNDKDSSTQNNGDNTGIEPFTLFKKLTTDWITSCPVAMPLAWDAYPMSLRLNNWLRAYMVFENELEQDKVFSQQLRQSMYTQSIFLEKHLEYHLLNNHLLENGRTLWLMGRFFNGSRADRWRKKGFTILMDCLEADFLADGGHNERSPMYHQIMLDVYQEVFDILNVANEPVPDILTTRLNDIKTWLANVLHPDGNLSLFHDCAFDIAGDPADFIDHDTTLTDGLTELTSSGYYIFRDQRSNNFMIVDCGSMGPDHNNGHGHCGALSFEASINGQRFIVDSGVDDYNGELAWRDYFRSTRAHNTIVIDGSEQSEIWERFRVARRYKVEDVVSAESDKLVYVAASHTGYRRLPGKVTHRRYACYVDNTFWVICDYISGSGTHAMTSFLHFHPDVQIIEYGLPADFGHTAKAIRDDVNLQVLSWGTSAVQKYSGQQSPIQGFYAPRFGECLKNTALGFGDNKQLPVWLGYVLIPGESASELTFTSDSQSAELIVKTGGTSYHLWFKHDKVDLKS